MGKLVSIGEILVDFIPKQKGVPLCEVIEFERVAGGAPANVAACVSKLGENALVLSKLGEDAFGDFLINELKNCNVDTSFIKRTNKANTGLAFVSLKEDGNRDFSFYRNPSADMLLSPEEIGDNIINEGDVLHFCSVDLIDSPMKLAHKKAIAQAIKNNAIISFDPNVRLPLWENHEDLRTTIKEFIPYAHILKISDEELEFITKEEKIENALIKLFVGNVKIVIYTKGPNGAELYTKKRTFRHNGYKVNAIDTTGSGDSFIGAFIYRILGEKRSTQSILLADFESYLEFSNKVGAIVASQKGGIPSMPSLQKTRSFLSKNE